MRLNTIEIQNFRGYIHREFTLHPEFNLVIGENGVGKTSFLEAAAVAIASWLLGFRGHDARNIRDRDVRKVIEFVEKRYRELPQYPVRVAATGHLHVAKALRNENGIISYVGADNVAPPKELPVIWERSIDAIGGRTTRQKASHLKRCAEKMAASVLIQQPNILPLIRYFGAGRLWESVRDTKQKAVSKHRKNTKHPVDVDETIDELEKAFDDFDRLSEPFYGYRMSVDKRCNPDDLIRWMAVERRNEIDEEEQSSALKLVYEAIKSLLPEVSSVRYSTKLRTLVIRYKKNKELHTFSELSDGFRNIVAIAADLAIKAAMLNPQLAEKALTLTPGVVLIDELDLHLHPIWQRRIISDLRRTFPKLQFICTTHSPFLIQSLRSGEELIVLDGQPTSNLGNMPVDEIARGIMHVSNTEVSKEYEEMKNTARQYLEKLEKADQVPEEKQKEFQEELARGIAPYAHNPAYQAFLEMMQAAKRGN